MNRDPPLPELDDVLLPLADEALDEDDFPEDEDSSGSGWVFGEVEALDLDDEEPTLTDDTGGEG